MSQIKTCADRLCGRETSAPTVSCVARNDERAPERSNWLHDSLPLSHELMVGASNMSCCSVAAVRLSRNETKGAMLILSVSWNAREKDADVLTANRVCRARLSLDVGKVRRSPTEPPI